MTLLAYACELPVLWVRVLLASVAIKLTFALLAIHLAWHQTETIVIATMLAWPAIALLLPFPSGWWWKQVEGGREPSGREHLAYQDSIELLQANSLTPLLLPKSWFVIDTPELNAAVCADTLMLTRGLIESDYLPAVIAHELGHLHSSDGRLSAAINRLIVFRRPHAGRATHEDRGIDLFVPPLSFNTANVLRWVLVLAAWTIRLIVIVLRFARGGFGLTLTRPLWGSYWRGREYHADDYAASLGQADELADFLEIYALLHDHPVPFIWLSEHTHPASELRIHRLRAYTQDEPLVVLPATAIRVQQ